MKPGARVLLALGACALPLLGLVAGASGQEMPMGMAMDERSIYVYLSLDQLELRDGTDERPLVGEAEGWVGGDFNKLWIRASGERATRGSAHAIEGQLLYGRQISPFWDVLIGVRADGVGGEGAAHARGLLAVGVQGLAPYWFQLEPTVFISQDGDLSARLDATYELLVTQRLILEPKLGLDVAAGEVPDLGVADGLSELEAGVRLRYEIVREIAPYVGVAWSRRGAIGSSPVRSGTEWVAGLRWWY